MNDLTLTAAEFCTLWTELDLGDIPYPLDVTEPEEPADTGHLRRDAEPWLRLLSEHTTALDLVADCEGPMRALAVTNGRAGVLAEMTRDGVRLTPIRPVGIANALLSLLPASDPGPGHALSVPVDALTQAAGIVDGGQDLDDFDQPWGAPSGALDERGALMKAGIAPNDAALLSELTTSRVAGGQFGVSFQDGGRRRMPGVVTWFDTAHGRYLMVKDGAWLSIAPADQARLVARVDRLLASAA